MSTIKTQIVKEKVEAMESAVFELRAILDTCDPRQFYGAGWSQAEDEINSALREISLILRGEDLCEIGIPHTYCGLCEHYMHMLTLDEQEQEEVPSYYITDAMKWSNNGYPCDDKTCVNGVNE